MHTNADISSALQQMELLKQAVEDSNNPKLLMDTSDDLKLVIEILQDPIFRDIVRVQDSLEQLNREIAQHPSILPNDFDFAVSGDLILKVPQSEMFDPDFGEEQRVPSSPNSYVKGKKDLTEEKPLDKVRFVFVLILVHIFRPLQSVSMLKKARGLTELSKNESTDDERSQSVVSEAKHDLQASDWIQVQALELVNDGTGLGFGIIGTKHSGVIVKTILAGGVADRDARLLSGDHILQIGDVNLHEMLSEQVASVLRQSGTHVRLVVARPVDPMHATEDVEGSAIVPSRLVQDPFELCRYLADAGYPEIFGQSTPSTPSAVELELPETERFKVELRKDTNGLGITIAGYVCEKEELSGIFVKSVSPGSAADLSGKISVNDRIVEVDGQSLQGFSNHQAVDVLKQSGYVVTLCLERYLRGPKYEQLQQAILANELKPSTPSTPPPPRIHKTSKHSAPDEMETSFSHERLPTKNPVLDQVPVLTTFGSGSRKKLVHARDSIETKLGHLTDDAPESTVDDDSEFATTNPFGESYRAPPPPANFDTGPESVLNEDARLAIVTKWTAILGTDVDIIVAQIRKFAAASGLGISLEGTVDVEGGKEVRPHHYIRSILAEGPVGQNGLLRSGDELLGEFLHF